MNFANFFVLYWVAMFGCIEIALCVCGCALLCILCTIVILSLFKDGEFNLYTHMTF